MNHQSNSGENQMEVIEENENQVDAADEYQVALNIEPHPAAFKLDIDCWEDVFDYLSLEDVYKFGQTCKTFKKVTGRYIQWKYENVVAIFRNDGIYINGKQMNGLSKFVNSVYFASEPHSITSHFETVKTVVFQHVNLNPLQVKLIENILSVVENLGIFNCNFDENIIEAIIGSCVNLKRLTIGPIVQPIQRFVWPFHSHSRLQQLILYDDKSLINNQLTTFIERCPNLKSLAISFSLLWKSRHSFLESKIGLDDFAIDMWQDSGNISNISNINNIDDIIGILNKLHQRRFYKKLHLKPYKFPEHNQLMALPGLVTLFIGYGVNTKFGPMDNIRELGIYVDFNISDIATNFMNLEQLFIVLPTINDLLQFVRYSIKLKFIKIRYFKEKTLDIFALNDERKKLYGARRIIIYVDEHVYLATKWAMKETMLDLIEIRRKASKQINRPHDFFNMFD